MSNGLLKKLVLGHGTCGILQTIVLDMYSFSVLDGMVTIMFFYELVYPAVFVAVLAIVYICLFSRSLAI